MWELDYKESWAPKNWCFELWCWRRLLRVPWTARRSNQSTLKEISPEYSLEGLILKVNPILWPPTAKNWLIGKDPDAGKDWKREEKGTTGWDGWMASLTQWTWVWVKSGSLWWRAGCGVLQSMESQRIRHGWASELFAFIKSLLNSSSLSAIKSGINCISEVIDLSSCNLDSSLCFIQPSILHDVCTLQSGNIKPWHTPSPIWNQSVPRLVLLLLDTHTDFSGGR